MKPTVSVIIPTYNRAKYLPNAIDSVLRQTFQDFELIVVDDGSTDITPEVMQRYAGDSRVRYVRKENEGCASARNLGLQHAKGRYVEHLDSDDILLENDLAFKVHAIESLPDDVAGVLSDCYRCLKQDHHEEKTFYQNFGFLEMVAELVDLKIGDDLYVFNQRFYELNLTQCLLSPNILLKKDVYDGVGLYDESMRSGQDWEWFVRFTRKYRVAYLDVPLMEYRFWIKGNVHDKVNLQSNTIKMYRRYLESESQSDLRAGLRRSIVVCHFNRAYAAYKMGQTKQSLRDALFALLHGYRILQSLGLICACVLPNHLREYFKQYNPIRGKPLEKS